jgi:DNA-binding NarL/FixJ family response regulator
VPTHPPHRLPHLHDALTIGSEHGTRVRDVSVLVIDDHTLFADAVQARLSREPDFRPVLVAYGAEQARARLATAPAVVVLDVAMGAVSGLDLLEDIGRLSPQTKVIMLTAVESVDAVLTALRRGARAWLPKTVDADHLVRVIRGVSGGEAWLAPALLGRVLTALVAAPAVAAPDPLDALTGREREVLQCMVDGLSRAEIAVRLRVSANTVRTHTQNLLAKLGVHSTLESVALALRHGLRASGTGPGSRHGES